MKTQDEVRTFIVDKLNEKKIAMNKASLLIGKQNSYLHQFITKKVPKRLPEIPRKKLALLLKVEEQELTDIDLSAPDFEPPFITAAGKIYDTAANTLKKVFTPSSVNIDIVDATACCGNGTENITEKRIGALNIPLQEFKEITSVAAEHVKLIRASGDSMTPTINDGDRVWVDVSNNFFSSDGIYLIRVASSIALKRIQISPAGLTVKSDNPIYGDFPLTEDGCQILGKAIYIWNGRRV